MKQEEKASALFLDPGSKLHAGLHVANLMQTVEISAPPTVHYMSTEHVPTFRRFAFLCWAWTMQAITGLGLPRWKPTSPQHCRQNDYSQEVATSAETHHPSFLLVTFCGSLGETSAEVQW